MSTHTPGPWHVTKGLVGREIRADAGPFIGWVYDLTTTYGERNANARLIAAAPELLAALQRAVETIRAFHGIGFPARGPAEAMAWALYQSSPEMQAINAAIAKAGG